MGTIPSNSGSALAISNGISIMLIKKPRLSTCYHSSHAKTLGNLARKANVTTLLMFGK